MEGVSRQIQEMKIESTDETKSENVVAVVVVVEEEEEEEPTPLALFSARRRWAV